MSLIRKIDRSYVSDNDRFLKEFYQGQEKSKSQQKEIAKHQHIAELRDNSDAGKQESAIWEDF